VHSWLCQSSEHKREAIVDSAKPCKRGEAHQTSTSSCVASVRCHIAAMHNSCINSVPYSKTADSLTQKYCYRLQRAAAFHTGISISYTTKLKCVLHLYTGLIVVHWHLSVPLLTLALREWRPCGRTCHPCKHQRARRALCHVRGSRPLTLSEDANTIAGQRRRPRCVSPAGHRLC
jgi:hypothetical protein